MIKINNGKAKIHGKMIVGAGSGQPPSIVGKYFFAETHDYDKNKWWTLESWYSNSNHTTHATELPISTTDVVVIGTVEPTVDLDRQDWVQPNNITSGSVGIVFTSALSGNVSCDIIGNATLQGNSTFNK